MILSVVMVYFRHFLQICNRFRNGKLKHTFSRFQQCVTMAAAINETFTFSGALCEYKHGQMDQKIKLCLFTD